MLLLKKFCHSEHFVENEKKNRYNLVQGLLNMMDGMEQTECNIFS